MSRRAWIAILVLLCARVARADDFIPPNPDRALVERFLATLGASRPTRLVEAAVPTVGCPADGQLGPMAPPKLPPRLRVLVPEGDEASLAYYKAGPTHGVLAPRGWRCFGDYGSSGDILLVAPRDSNPKLFSLGDAATKGEAVLLNTSYGGTSGRFDVAAVAARLFPVVRAFVASVRKEGIADPHDFVFAPWPGDTLYRLADRAVAYLTPVAAKGLGNTPELAAGIMPVLGIAFLAGPTDAPDLTVLRFRPGAGDMSLYPAIAINALPSVAQSLHAPRAGR